MPGPGNGDYPDPIKPLAASTPVSPPRLPTEPVAPEINRLEVEDVVEISTSVEISSTPTIPSQDESGGLDVTAGRYLDLTG
ncbi:hypothetical protein SCOR_28215 [Sulfidibacter corallicola]|uniref:Uncharacterized protein n=1 Tax=Sulfidibacter corallicola TaxID=2818388 RepID=A0A8A4TM64_SULCO|nr:hypothetical protein [Sulfidibacter corallicola]QTD50557.1 hypothetical protein J3U87_33655 [Sulfidibacter corallicola]